MTGGLMQLVAFGAQDVFLVGNPQITFWKVVYRRHTNFAIESIQQTFTGDANMNKKLVCTVDRNGDLMHRVYLQADVDLSKIYSDVAQDDTPGDSSPSLPADASLAELTLDGLPVPAEYIGFYLIEYNKFDVGGQEIDEQFGDWMHIWNELTLPAEQEKGFKEMVGIQAKDLTLDNASDNHPFTGTKTLYVPFQFWFNRNPGLALPLIALQYHQVKFEVGIQPASFFDNTTFSVTNSSGSQVDREVRIEKGFLQEAALWVDYVYLDTDERRRFAQISHEYLIEQVQFTGDEAMQNKIQINFNHPVKELIWYIYNETGLSSNSNYNADFGKARILLNSQDRFTEREPRYFNLVQPYQHHTRIPAGDDMGGNATETTRLRNLKDHLYVYSFALKPEEHQPSGSCNFSRIDTAQIRFTQANRAKYIKLFARNYNVFRVMSGLGGLAYAS